MVALAIAGCPPPPEPSYVPAPPQDPPPAETGGEQVAQPVAPVDVGNLGTVVDHSTEFRFQGGQIDYELRRDGDRVVQIARNHYMVPMMIHWEISALVNLEPTTQMSGAALLPPATKPQGQGEAVELGEARVIDNRRNFHRELATHQRFGDPRAQPKDYAYGIPYLRGLMYTVLQGFHGAFSHRGSNEYAVDFDCPVATRVLAARDGLVVATNDAAQGSGSTPEFLRYDHVNFVIVMHDDGTLGEYLHLSPSGVVVKPGARVRRGQELALSGFTGYSSTPHLHFQVMTAATDGIAAHSFPFKLAVSADRAEAPVQGRAYLSWE